MRVGDGLTLFIMLVVLWINAGLSMWWFAAAILAGWILNIMEQRAKRRYL